MPDLTRARLDLPLALVAFGAVLSAMIALPAMAHENHVILYGPFLSGFTHPVLGLDHFMAMVSVGIVSAIIGGHAIWGVPATFVAMMAVGGLLGWAEVGIPMVGIQAGIALSVVLLGMIIAVYRPLPPLYVAIPVAFFGVLHGYAHGAEIPAIGGPAIYAAGFMTGTVFIHILGVLVGDISRRYQFGRIGMRIVGAIFVVFGVLFLFGVI